ncbi:Hint domain-containing protein [Roseicyclus marinus]|uniref:Hint domain-containing protein n=1 Tax=Roseicyclus marinus TaxID=2161673 RepID=UPI00240EEC87|nr:Hint domain-containing protein [Roseicyclus marinus]MDG3040541.1 Hint domain-containing protein [Roseicyclus marinus]
MSVPMRHESFGFPASLAGDDTGLSGRAKAEGIGLVAGTRVATPGGYVAVERLAVGDRVLTQDGHQASLVWVGLSCMPGKGAFAPVRIETGAMDNMRPVRLGQGHLLRVAGWQAELLFEAEAVFATARSLVDGARVTIDDSAESVIYIHLMLEHHGIILAENLACETLRPGPDAALMLAALAAEAEYFEHAPLPISGQIEGCMSALPVLSGDEARVLKVA